MIARLLIGLVRLYQMTLSIWVGDRCRFFPSCSQYMIEALRIHGALRGTALGVRRILRCQPLCRGGFDFVPPKSPPRDGAE